MTRFVQEALQCPRAQGCTFQRVSHVFKRSYANLYAFDTRLCLRFSRRSRPSVVAVVRSAQQVDRTGTKYNLVQRYWRISKPWASPI